MTRWFLTCVNQPQFFKVLGKVSLCEKMGPVAPTTGAPAKASTAAAASPQATKATAAPKETKADAAPKTAGDVKEDAAANGKGWLPYRCCFL